MNLVIFITIKYNSCYPFHTLFQLDKPDQNHAFFTNWLGYQLIMYLCSMS